MAEAVKWGILGAANFARTFMAPAIHAARGAELVALASSSPAKVEPFHAFCPGLRVHTSYEAILADPEIEAVYIPLPNHLHVEWAVKALAAGKHVLCEKPIAMTEADFDTLIAARDQAGKLLAEAYMIVHHPQWLRARDLVQQGAIGRLMHVDGVFCYRNTDPANIRNRSETGGGGVRDIGVYPYGATRFVTGAEPEEISARLQLENGVDTWAQVTGRFTGGFTFSAMTSTRSFARQEMVFQGEEGLIRLTAPFNARVFGEARVELHRSGLSVTTERFPAASQYELQVEAFGRALRGGEGYPCPLEFSRGTQAMIDRILAEGEVIRGG